MTLVLAILSTVLVCSAFGDKIAAPYASGEAAHLTATKHKIDDYLAKTHLLGKRRLQVEAKFLNTPLEYQYLNQYHNYEHPLTYTKIAPHFGFPYHGKGKPTFTLQPDGPYAQTLAGHNVYGQSRYARSPYNSPFYGSRVHANSGYGHSPFGQSRYSQLAYPQPAPYGYRQTLRQPAPQQNYAQPSFAYTPPSFAQPTYPPVQSSFSPPPSYGQNQLLNAPAPVQTTYRPQLTAPQRTPPTYAQRHPQQPSFAQQPQIAYQDPRSQLRNDADDGQDNQAFRQVQGGYVEGRDSAVNPSGVQTPDQPLAVPDFS